jgi:hypothetical protein
MGLLTDLSNVGCRRGYERYVLALEPVLAAMGARGIPVSPARHAEVKTQLEQARDQAYDAMQKWVPDEVRACTPKHGYVREPKDTTGMVKRNFNVRLPGTIGITDPVIEERWVKLQEWSPSHQGLIRYMQFKGHSVPTDYKTGKPSTKEMDLTRLAAKVRDPLYDAVLVYRQISTVLDNHMKNWTPGPDGRVHPTFYYDTGTGQLASRRPNAQNAPKHGEGAKGERAADFRSMVEAPVGYKLVEADYKSFHVQTLAFCARDADLLRLAKLDVHSYLTAHFFHLPGAGECLGWDNDRLRAYLADIKARYTEVRDAKIKHAMLGYNNGMGYRKLYNQYMEFFSSMGEAKRVLEMLDALFPVAAKFRRDVRMQAHEQGYLVSPFGCIRWFWEVMRWQGEWKPGGDDSEAALSFLAQNTAHCHIKEAMLRLNQSWGQYLINQIHDSLMFEVPDALVEQCVAGVKAEMERPSEVLVDPVLCPGGLSIEVEVKVGQDWSRMRRVSC